MFTIGRDLLQRGNLDLWPALVQHGADFRGGGDAVRTGGPVACNLRSWPWGGRERVLLFTHLLDFGRRCDFGLGHDLVNGDLLRSRAAGLPFVQHLADLGRGGDAITTNGRGLSFDLTCRGEKSDCRGSDE